LGMGQMLFLHIGDGLFVGGQHKMKVVGHQTPSKEVNIRGEVFPEVSHKIQVVLPTFEYGFVASVVDVVGVIFVEMHGLFL